MFYLRFRKRAARPVGHRGAGSADCCSSVLLLVWLVLLIFATTTPVTRGLIVPSSSGVRVARHWTPGWRSFPSFLPVTIPRRDPAFTYGHCASFSKHAAAASSSFSFSPRGRFAALCSTSTTTSSNTATHPLPRIQHVGPCLGSGSYGTVHFLSVCDAEDDDTSTGCNDKTEDEDEFAVVGGCCVGKRAWTEADLALRHPDFAQEQLKEKAMRCRYYWTVEQHCFEKMMPDEESTTAAAAITDFRGSTHVPRFTRLQR